MRTIRSIFAILFLAGLPGLAAATAPEGAAVEVQAMTARELIEAGGLPMIVLGLLSVAALAFVIYLAVVLRMQAVFPRGFLGELRAALEAGRADEARLLCGRQATAIGAIAGTALAFTQRHPDPDPTLLKEMIEGEGSRQAAQFQNQTHYLLDIAVIAPMVGLLRTVMGMLQAFNAVALDIAKVRPMVLAGGVSQALVTTAAGLLVGIPAMAFYAFFRGRVARLVATLETGSAEILSLLTERRS